jgi:hypothetical protein
MNFRKGWNKGALRLKSMTWDELRTRTAQEVSKRWDAAIYSMGIGAAAGGIQLDRSYRPSRAERTGADRLREESAVPAQFFFAPRDISGIAELVCQELPQQAQTIVERAHQIRKHRFDLLGYRNIEYGKEIDWHRDAVHGKRAPRKPWYKVQFLNFAEVGDHKVIWELNRHQHLITLAKAFLLTQDDSFAREADAQWGHWQRENPYPIGINWASSLEVAFRSLSWMWVDHLLRASPGPCEAFRAGLLKALALSGNHIERYISTYFSPNTHLLGEAVALFFIGLLYPELRSASRWRRSGWEIILQEAERQVGEDGMHFEHSIYYHVYALDFFLHARLLASRNQIQIPEALDRKVEKMLEALLLLGQAGTIPRWGDDDGGRLFDSHRNQPEQLFDPLCTGAVLFGRGDFKSASGLVEETLWLLGQEGLDRWKNLPESKAGGASACLADSRVYVMADSAPLPQQLVVISGSGGGGSGGHGHADALSITLAVDGKELLTDPGTFCYIDEAGDREYFRSTQAHNTLQVDGLSQGRTEGPFSWKDFPAARTEHWVVGKTFDLFSGSHTGYRRLTPWAIHRRWVFHLKPYYWLVHDAVEGIGEHLIEIFWHLATSLTSFQLKEESALAFFSGKGPSLPGSGLAVLPVVGRSWLREITQAGVSPAYGRVESGFLLRFHHRTPLPTDYAVILRPISQNAESLGELRAITDGGKDDRVRAYLYERREAKHHVFFSKPGPPWTFGGWGSDAEFLYYASDAENEREHLVLCGGTFVEMQGRRHVYTRHRVARYEMQMCKTAREVFCSDDNALLL